jgi:hypothetical protein
MSESDADVLDRLLRQDSGPMFVVKKPRRRYPIFKFIFAICVVVFVAMYTYQTLYNMALHEEYISSCTLDHHAQYICELAWRNGGQNIVTRPQRMGI